MFVLPIDYFIPLLWGFLYDDFQEVYPVAVGDYVQNAFTVPIDKVQAYFRSWYLTHLRSANDRERFRRVLSCIVLIKEVMSVCSVSLART